MEQHVALVTEVTKEGALGQPGGVSDLRRRRLLEALGGEQLERGLLQPLGGPRYRERYGLQLLRALEPPQRRQHRSELTRRRMATEPALRAMLDAGAQAARSGQLIADHHAAITASARRSAQRQERQRSLQQRGRRRNAVSRAQNSKLLRARAIALGFPDIDGYLGERYARGWSISRIAAELRCARETASALLAEVGAPGPLDPAHPVEQAALHRVGHPDLVSYLTATDDRSPTRLARCLGHSVPWLTVRARREGKSSIGGHPDGGTASREGR